MENFPQKSSYEPMKPQRCNKTICVFSARTLSISITETNKKKGNYLAHNRIDINTECVGFLFTFKFRNDFEIQNINLFTNA